LTVVTKRVENNDFKIDFISFSDSDYSADSFYQSVNYDPSQGSLLFTIPEIIPKGYKFFLHVSGRLYMGDKQNGMCFHAFEKESETYSWKTGKTYIYFLNPEGIDKLSLTFGLVDVHVHVHGETHDGLYDIQISAHGTKCIEPNN